MLDEIFAANFLTESGFWKSSKLESESDSILVLIVLIIFNDVFDTEKSNSCNTVVDEKVDLFSESDSSLITIAKSCLNFGFPWIYQWIRFKRDILSGFFSYKESRDLVNLFLKYDFVIAVTLKF